jgi:hypothetical protein
MESSMLLELVLWAAVIWAAYRIGQLSILWPIQRVLTRVAAEQGQTLDQLLADVGEPSRDSNQNKETPLVIERVGSKYYVYEDQGQFLAQGEDFDQLFSDIRDRFPNRNFRVPSTPQGFSAEEAGRMTDSIFRVFGEKHG